MLCCSFSLVLCWCCYFLHSRTSSLWDLSELCLWNMHWISWHPVLSIVQVFIHKHQPPMILHITFCNQTYWLFRQWNNPLLHPRRGLKWIGGPHLKLSREAKSVFGWKRCEQMRSLIWNWMNEILRLDKGNENESVVYSLGGWGGNNLCTWLVFGVSPNSPGGGGGGARFSRPIMLLFTKLFCRLVPFADPAAGAISNSTERPLSKAHLFLSTTGSPAIEIDMELQRLWDTCLHSVVQCTHMYTIL